MSDIKQINGKYYDFGTKNETFLLTAKELQTVGIKNYYFMLRIDNPRLADIDPFKKNITAQEIQALMHEFKNNIWSFIRMAVRLRTNQGIVPFGLHRGLAAGIWCFDKCQDFCLCEPRQTWKTTGLIASCIQWAYQLARNTNIHFYGKETDNTKRNLQHLKNDIELLPEWLQFRTFLDTSGNIKKSRASTMMMSNNLTHNQVDIHPKPSSISHAQGLGRGGSGPVLYYDEIEHTPYISHVIENSYPLFKTAAENAAVAGSKYCRIMSCTPGDLDTKEGMEALPIIESMMPWTEKVYDMTPEQFQEYKSASMGDYRAANKNSTREPIDVFYIEYLYYQIRKDYSWVQEQLAGIGNKRTVRREILMQRLHGSDKSPFDPDDIEALISNVVKSDKDLIINNKWRFRLYEHGQLKNPFHEDHILDEHIPYLVGVDPAGGEGGDNFAVCIVNPYNLQIAAEFKSEYMGLTEGVKMLVSLIDQYIPKGVLIIEKNSIGQYLIQNIVDSTTIKENLYWSEKEAQKQLDDISIESPDDNRLKALSVKYKKYGVYNTRKTREAMLEILFRHVREFKEVINTEYLVEDICKLERNPKTHKVAAVAGAHDDSLFAYLHTMNIYYNGDNLIHFGINKEEHPIVGAMQDDYKERIVTETNQWFPTNNIKLDTEEYAMRHMAMLENQSKELINKYPHIYQDNSIKRVEHQNPYDDTIDINPIFFDEMNGFLD